MIGPLFWFELVRLARKGFHTRFRILAGLIPLVVLFLQYLKQFPSVDPLDLIWGTSIELSINQSAEFAAGVMHVFLFVQLALVVLLTPVVVAGSIVEEIQRKSLLFLLSTPLTSREIVFSKVLARCYYVFGILLTGLPILACVQFLGGIDFTQVLASYIVIIVTMLHLSALTVAKAIEHRRMRQSLTDVYMLFLGFSLLFLLFACVSSYLVILTPFGFLGMLFYDSWMIDRPLWIATGLFSLFHLVGTTFYIRQATRLLRKRLSHEERYHGEQSYHMPGGTYIGTEVATKWEPYAKEKPLPPELQEDVIPLEGEQPKPTNTPDGPVVIYQAEAVRYRPPTDYNDFLDRYNRVRLPIRIDPFLWKELEFGSYSMFQHMGCIIALLLTVVLVTIPAGIIFLLSGTINALENDKPLAPIYNPLFQWLGIFVLLIWCLMAGTRASQSVTREREQDTLLSLLTLPVRRVRILNGKWRAGWLSIPYLPRGMLVFVGLCMVTTGLHWSAVPLAIVFFFALIHFSISLGIWLSVKLPNSFRASLYWWFTMLLVMSAPLLVGMITEFAWPYLSPMGWEKARIDLFIQHLSPVLAWFDLTFCWIDIENWRRQPDSQWIWQLSGACTSMLCLFLFHILCWRSACRHFETEGR